MRLHYQISCTVYFEKTYTVKISRKREFRSRYLKDIMQLFSNFKSRIKFFLRYLQLNTSIIQHDKNIIVQKEGGGKEEGGGTCF